jgi:uncharacterized membrane protein
VILQALRPEFPDALFFTTDLDARLLHPSDQRPTRKLLVASSFGLELTDKFQGDIPPFRGTYQTATFLATQLAINGCEPYGGGHDCRDLPWLREPLLFEIGQRTAVALPYPHKKTARCAGPSPCPVLQPDAGRLYPVLAPGLGSFIVVTALAAVVLLLIALGIRQIHRLREHGRTEPPADQQVLANANEGTRRPLPRLGYVLVGTVALSAVFGLAALAVWPALANRLTENGSGEPMTLFEGISIWPTIFLRFISLCLGIGLFFYCIVRLDSNIDEIRKDLRLTSTRDILAETMAGGTPSAGL